MFLPFWPRRQRQHVARPRRISASHQNGAIGIAAQKEYRWRELLRQPTAVDVPRRAAHLYRRVTAQEQHQFAQLLRRDKLL